MKQRIVAVDFDGVLCADSPNVYADFVNEHHQPLMAGAVEGMAWLRKQGFEIVIYTCREYGQRKFLETFLSHHGLEHDYIVFHGKPRADFYIDDKAVRFTNWPDVVKTLSHGAEKNFHAEPNTLFEESLKRERWNYIPRIAGSLLDVGCGRAPFWPEWVECVDVVEPDAASRLVVENHARVEGVHADVLEVNTDSYEMAVALGVLEHVEEPQSFLASLSGAKKIFITVPNAESFHRGVGLLMGLLPDYEHLSVADFAVGHQRYYTASRLEDELGVFCRAQGYRIKSFGSCGFKVADNETMATLLSTSGLITAVNAHARKVGLIGENMFAGAELFALLVKDEVKA